MAGFFKRIFGGSSEKEEVKKEEAINVLEVSQISGVIYHSKTALDRLERVIDRVKRGEANHQYDTSTIESIENELATAADLLKGSRKANNAAILTAQKLEKNLDYITNATTRRNAQKAIATGLRIESIMEDIKKALDDSNSVLTITRKKFIERWGKTPRKEGGMGLFPVDDFKTFLLTEILTPINKAHEEIELVITESNEILAYLKNLFKIERQLETKLRKVA